MEAEVIELKPKIDFDARSMTQKISSIGATPMPVVTYTREAWETIWQYVKLCKYEIGWLGLVDETPNGYLITEVFLLEQEVSGATTEIESDAIANLAVALESRGVDSTRLRYWGHSHVDMGVTPSGRDEDQLKEYLENGCEFFIRGIYNKKMEAKLDIFDMRTKLVYQKCDQSVSDPNFPNDWVESIRNEINTKVKQKVYTPPAQQGQQFKNTPNLYNGKIWNNKTRRYEYPDDYFEDFSWKNGGNEAWEL